MAEGLDMAFKNLSEVLLVDLMVSVLPYLNHRVVPLSYIALVILYSLLVHGTETGHNIIYLGLKYQACLHTSILKQEPY